MQSRVVLHDVWSARSSSSTCLPTAAPARYEKSRSVLFRAAYPGIRALAAEARSTKLLVSVLDARTLQSVARALVDVRPGQPTPLVLGRHSFAHLQLGGDEVSLRQLLVLVHPMRSLDPAAMRYSVRDLRSTANSFRDEQDRPHQAIVAQGAVLLFFDRYALFLVPIDERTELPPSAEEAEWLLPPPLVVSESVIERPREAPSDAAATRITSIGGPVQAEAWTSCRGTPVGELHVRSPDRNVSLLLAREDLRRGLIVGRHSRCDTSVMDGTLSRVHAMVLELEGAHYVIDTGSTNGTCRAGEQERIAIDRLAHGSRYRLGNHTAIEWLTAGSAP